MSRNNVRKMTVPLKNDLEYAHELILELIAENSALAEEIFRLVRDVRRHVSLLSAVFSAKTENAASSPWEQPCPPFKM